MRVPRPVITVLAAVAVLATLGTVAAGLVFSFRGPGSETTTPARESALPAAPAILIKPVAVRPVVGSRATTPEQCPPPAPHVPPTETLEACDIEGTAAYTLGPVAMQLQLTRVESIPQWTVPDSYVVRIEMDAASSAAFAGYTAAHVGQQVAFVRNGVVVSAPGISAPINSPALQLSGEMTGAQAQEVARRLRDEA